MTEGQPGRSAPDLAHLVNAAQDEVVDKQLASARRQTSAPRKPPLILKGLSVAVAVGALALAYHFAGPWLFGYSNRAIYEGLVATTEAARTSVEAYRKEHGGALPPGIPNLTLATFVQYEPGDTTYRLTAGDGAVTITMEADGTVSGIFGR